MRRKQKYLLVISLFILVISCNNHKNENFSNRYTEKVNISKERLSKIAESKNKFAYIDVGVFTRQRKDNVNYICIYNVEDSSLTRLTNKDDYERLLCWSPDGKKLLFTSTKYTYNPITDKGENWKKISLFELFIFDIIGGTIKLIENENLKDIHDYTGLAWTESGVYFTLNDNKLYRMKSLLLFEAPEIVFEVNNNYKIYLHSASNNGKDILFSRYIENSDYSSQLGLYNVETKEAKFIFDNVQDGRIQGWSSSSEEVYFLNKDKVYQYNINTGEKSNYVNLINSKKLKIKKVFGLNNGSLVYTAMQEIDIDTLKNIREYSFYQDVTIGIEQKNSKETWYPIENNTEKLNFTAYIP